MKIKKTILCLTLLLGFTTMVEAQSLSVAASQPVVPQGTWILSFYKGPGETKVTSSLSICGGIGGWGTSGPVRLNYGGNGNLLQEGTNIYLSGELDEGGAYSILSGFGLLAGSSEIVGHYQKFHATQTSSSEIEYGIFKAVYEGPACAL